MADLPMASQQTRPADEASKPAPSCMAKRWGRKACLPGADLAPASATAEEEEPGTVEATHRQQQQQQQQQPQQQPQADESKNAATTKTVVPIVFDMETGDPDDVLTLLLLLSHPRVHLKAVTITPGTRSQVALVSWILAQFPLEHQVRLGAQDWPSNAAKSMGAVDQLKGFYSSFKHATTFECERAVDVLADVLDEETTLLTGGPLHNLGATLERPGWRLGRWVGQGGFAGVGVMDDVKILAQFAGKTHCQTWNFNGNIKAAEAALASPLIGRRVLASKNVCHGVFYNDSLHDLFAAVARKSSGKQQKALQMIVDSMATYLRKKGSKKFHDPLAFALCLDEGVCELKEVETQWRRGEGWGSELRPGSRTWISTDFDRERFSNALFGTSSTELREGFRAGEELARYVASAGSAGPE